MDEPHPALRAMAEEAADAEAKEPDPPGLRLQLRPLVNKENSP